MSTTPSPTPSAAVALRESGPSALVEQYRQDFAQVLPTHLRPDVWTRITVGVLRRDPKLAQAATNNPTAFMGALMTAARLGLEPGTEQFYLVPRKQKGVLEIQGIVGYQGIVELMYRAGAVSSVVVEAVREKDLERFSYVPGRDPRPVHEIDWFSERGPLVGVYAYAIMRDGATSKVVVLNRQDIAKARAKSDSAHSEYSPWNTNEEAMWLKTAARRLAKWVPTSAEWLFTNRSEWPFTQKGVPSQNPLLGDGLLDEDDRETATEVVEGELLEHDHPGPWSETCQTCRAESAALDRAAADA